VISLGRAVVWGLCCLTIGVLYGCGFLDMVAGVQTGPNGEVLGAGPGLGDQIVGVASSYLPYGGGLAVLLRWGLVEYRHHRLVAAGKKDEDRNGIEDPPSKAPTA
jgi:hypothetical protein